MCGLTGFLDCSQRSSSEVIENTIRAMTATLTHRGPDDGGVWTDANAGIALGHRRLAIVDLSAAGHQPMTSASGRYVIAFNGEIYNHLAIRAKLREREWTPDHPLVDALISSGTTEFTPFKGHSDTETLLAAIDAFGVGETLKQCVGMFAFALWDRQDKLLYLARDRLGEKPLYYGFQGDILLFGSELKALRQHPSFNHDINRSALALLLRHNFIPAPHTIYSGIQKLPAGTYIAVGTHRPNAQPVTYWSAKDSALKGQLRPFQGTESEALERLDHLLREAIQGQMMADVPIGAFLSGGFDSSLVVALMQAQSPRPVNTFTIGFEAAAYNEAEAARAVAQHLGTHHTDLLLTPADALAIIPGLPAHYDEPFADSSQIPTLLVAKLARESVTVSLSGDGGDELFGGYNRHVWAMQIGRRLRFFPQGARQTLSALMTAFPPHAWDTLFRTLGFMLPSGLRYSSPGDKIHKLSQLLSAKTPEALYLDLLSHWKDPSRALIGNPKEPATVMNDPTQWPELREVENRMMYLDQVGYLPDDILVKVDRAAMAVSLETRIPFLDHRVFEFAATLPLSMKIRDNEGKWLLRQLLYRHVPKALVERPKMGFGVPIDDWLRGPLKDWAEALIEPQRLKKEGYFHPRLIQEKWLRHQSGRHNESHRLWSVLMFQAWLESTH